MNTKWFIIILILIATSCVEEYDPVLDKFEEVLVIDGQITNEKGPYTIKISIASNTNILKTKPVSNAKVYISTIGGLKERLYEFDPGEYKTKQNGIQGIIGEKYKLSITTQNGKKYESPYEELLKPTALETIEGKEEYHTIEESNTNTIGYQFYATTGISNYNRDYYLWFMEGTYKIKTLYPIQAVYDGHLRYINNPDTLKICYASYNINEVFTGSTEGLTSKKLTNQTLCFIPGNDKKLEIRYSLLVKQYSINEQAYYFWHNIQKQSTSGSSLYTSQPFQIKGNIKSIYNEDETVLGYFLVAGVSKKRIFVNRPEKMRFYEKCEVNSYKVFEFLNLSLPSEWPIYLTPSENGISMASGTCIDCTDAKGSSLKKPDFWID